MLKKMLVAIFTCIIAVTFVLVVDAEIYVHTANRNAYVGQLTLHHQHRVNETAARLLVAIDRPHLTPWPNPTWVGQVPIGNSVFVSRSTVQDSALRKDIGTLTYPHAHVAERGSWSLNTTFDLRLPPQFH